MNIGTRFLEYVEELNISNIKFKNALNRFTTVYNMGLFIEVFWMILTDDIMSVTLLIVLAVIIMVFICNHRKYGINGARNAKLEQS